MTLNDLIKNRYKAIAGQLFYRMKKITPPIERELVKVDGRIFRTAEIVTYLETGEPVFPIGDKKEIGNYSKKFTHCCYCGEELPEEEIAMKAANHRECWRTQMTKEKEARAKLLEQQQSIEGKL